MAEVKKKETSLVINSQEEFVRLFGKQDEHLRLIQEKTGVDFVQKESCLIMRGDPAAVDAVNEMLAQLLIHCRNGRVVEMSDIRLGLSAIEERKQFKADDLEPVYMNGSGRPIKPRTRTQKDYIEGIRAKDLMFGVGPAGTGKTYLAVAMALKMLLDKEVKRIVLTRPAVEAGEKLGFLPGDMQQKVDPYLRPLFDAMYDILDYEKCARLMERGVIEVAPIAFMRGRTLESSFIILDEAQNATIEQLRMFLTRMGKSSKMVVTGDITQIDLPNESRSGLLDAIDRFKKIEEIGFIYFSEADVMRHELVRKIIKAYGKSSKKS